jgi:hypothetical protein
MKHRLPRGAGLILRAMRVHLPNGKFPHKQYRRDITSIANRKDLNPTVRDTAKRILERIKSKPIRPPAFGIWKDKPVDSLAYQKTLRKEWD